MSVRPIVLNISVDPGRFSVAEVCSSSPRLATLRALMTACMPVSIRSARPTHGLGLSTTTKVTLLGALRLSQPSRLRPLPRMCWPVQAGFPSPAEDDQDAAIDLNELLAPHPEACFLLRVSGHSMTGAGIDDGDTLIVDRALEPSHGRIVIAVIDGEFTVKRLHRDHQSVRLEAAHQDYPPITLSDGQELQVWGVVTRVIKQV